MELRPKMPTRKRQIRTCGEQGIERDRKGGLTMAGPSSVPFHFYKMVLECFRWVWNHQEYIGYYRSMFFDVFELFWEDFGSP